MSDWYGRWREVGDRVVVRRHRALDLNVTVVLGEERSLVVDTHSHDGWARELVDAVRTLTPGPWVVLDTHAHFDHAFGNHQFALAQPGLDVWGHARCAAQLRDDPDHHRRLAVEYLSAHGTPADVEAARATPIVPPHRTFEDEVVVDLGGRAVRLWFAGRGHTDHDVLVDVPDAGVTVAGDLVEEGGPPSFDDSFPWEWPATLDAVLPRLRPVVVPGHGDVVDPAYVRAQRAELAQIGEVAAGLPAGAGSEAVRAAAARLAIGEEAGVVALGRALVTRGAPRAGGG